MHSKSYKSEKQHCIVYKRRTLAGYDPAVFGIRVRRDALAARAKFKKLTPGSNWTIKKAKWLLLDEEMFAKIVAKWGHCLERGRAPKSFL